jgi:GxxExxY protein
LGYGFLEKVYENAIVFELKKHGFVVKQQVSINVYYEDQVVGEYFADLLVQDKVIVELKAVHALADAHEAQLINYLKATSVEVGLVLNFGAKPEFKRKVFTNIKKLDRKKPNL